jgi:hypothetical protein
MQQRRHYSCSCSSKRMNQLLLDMQLLFSREMLGWRIRKENQPKINWKRELTCKTDSLRDKCRLCSQSELKHYCAKLTLSPAYSEFSFMSICFAIEQPPNNK